MKRALLIVLFAGGCSGFDLVAPVPESPPFLSIEIDVVREETSRYFVTARFAPGVNSSGEPVAVSDGRLQVEGTLLEPLAESSRSVLSYEWQGERPAAGVDTIHLRIPRAGSSPTIDFSVEIPLPGREDPFNVSLPAGGDLRLRVALASTPALSPALESWQLRVRRAAVSGGIDSGSVAVFGQSRFPPEIRVPWEWIKTAARDSLIVMLQSQSSYRAVGAPYRVDVFANALVNWHVRVLDSQPLPRLRGIVRDALLRDTLHAP